MLSTDLERSHPEFAAMDEGDRQKLVEDCRRRAGATWSARAALLGGAAIVAIAAFASNVLIDDALVTFLVVAGVGLAMGIVYVRVLGAASRVLIIEELANGVPPRTD